MGSSNSRLGSRSLRTRVNRSTRFRLPFLICGGSSAHGSREMEDYPAELLAERHNQVNIEAQNLMEECLLISGTGTGFTSPHIETGALSESSLSASEDTSVEDGSRDVETSNQAKYFSESKELVPLNQVSDDRHEESYRGRSRTMGSTLFKEQQSSDPVSVNSLVNKDSFNVVDNSVSQGVVQMRPSSSSPQGLRDPCSNEVCVENHMDEVSNVHNIDVVPNVSDSVVTIQSPLRDESLQEAIPSGLGFLVSDRERSQADRNVLQVDVVSISSNILSGSNTSRSDREARRSGRRLFWDAFSRRSSRRLSNSRTVISSTDGADDIGTHDRWLLDFGGEYFDEIGGDSGYPGSRFHSLNERRRHSRSEIWERLRSGLNENGRRNAFCPTGLHPDGRCSCESLAMTEESSTRASISRIVLLAEALFEVLDEIHRVPLSLSMASMPAPESVVNSFPLRHHKRPDTLTDKDDVEQCYICLAEYENGDKIRVLPCHHEYHMSCVDKWLKEIHGVCPLCRGDVCQGTQSSVANSEIPSV